MIQGFHRESLSVKLCYAILIFKRKGVSCGQSKNKMAKFLTYVAQQLAHTADTERVAERNGTFFLF